MKLRGIDFGRVWGASGVQGFFGEGYPFHRIFKALFGGMFSFGGMTFVAKTMTWRPREGNMPRREDGITPRERRPACIVVKFRKRVALNAVGLSNLGAEALLETGRWHAWRDPHFLSFAAVGGTPSVRLRELEEFVDFFGKTHQPYFKGPHGLQINLSCPNVGIYPEELVEEASDMLSAARSLEIPLAVKVNVLVPPHAAYAIAAHAACDAICISNSIPWGALPDRIDWEKLFGSTISPLAKFDGGALSGAPLLPLVVEWIREARRVGVKKHINGGGGILHPRDVRTLHNAGADSVAIGSLAILRPWRLRAVIQAAQREFPNP